MRQRIFLLAVMIGLSLIACTDRAHQVEKDEVLSISSIMQDESLPEPEVQEELDESQFDSDLEQEENSNQDDLDMEPPVSQPENSFSSNSNEDWISLAPSSAETPSQSSEHIDTEGTSPISPQLYQKRLGKGIDVDWSKTEAGRQYYSEKTAEDFAKAGISHVRIRIKDNANDSLFTALDKQIEDCLKYGIIPIIAYQADEFKNQPSEKNIKKVTKWWAAVADRYKDISHLLSFDLLIEVTDALNKQPEKLNEIYERLVAEIRKTNPTRIIMISPRLRSDAAYLHELKIPSQHNNYLMAEWHFYASGPSKKNERKLWTTGTDAEKALILEKISLAADWQKNTGIPTWVGAWMPGNYNDGNDYTIAEQVAFADFMTTSLTNANIPFAVNSDTKFYDRERLVWVEEMKPVFNAIYR